MEITALAQAAFSAATPSTAAAAPTPPAAAPSALATERFNAVMNAPDTDPSQPTAIQSALQAAFATPAPASDAQTSLGGQILAGLQSSATQVSQQWQSLATSIDHVSAMPSLGDMLQVQARLLQVEVQYNLMSKAVSKATSNVDTLVRMS